jgi:predicted transcriptional regulator
MQGVDTLWSDDMVRTHIQLREDQAAAIKRLVHERSVSMAAVIRDAVDQYVERESDLSLDDRWQRSLAAVGGFHSGGDEFAAASE